MEVSWFHSHLQLGPLTHGRHSFLEEPKCEPLKLGYSKREPLKLGYSKCEPLKLGPLKFFCSRLKVPKLELLKF